jgi:hypothetical protein
MSNTQMKIIPESDSSCEKTINKNSLNKYHKGATMRKSAMAMILTLTSLVSSAQPNIYENSKPVVCSDVKTIIEGLSDQYNEQPFWNGIGEDTKYILLVNPKTMTWSMVEYNNKIACIIGTGKGSKQIFSRPMV